MAKQYYALLIGIDEYPKGMELRGCVNDLEAMLAYLSASIPAEAFHPTVLRNAEATRERIGTAFAEFTAGAQDGDVALIYFSGHGSRCTAPAEFAELESADGKLNTLVCWDSRRPGGRDLFDKEVSYLIWKAVGGRKLHLVTVFDCCHSGGATRGTRPRQAPEVSRRETMLRQMAGFETYEDRTDDRGQRTLQPPRAEHLAFAAAAKAETAKETTLAGLQRGAFTFNLLRVLSDLEQPISYTQLIGILRARVAQTVSRQTPELDSPAGWAEEAWLGGILPPARTWTLVSAGAPDRWRLLAGQLQGLPTSDFDRVELLVPDTDVKLGLRSVDLDSSEVKLVSGQLDPEKTYEAVVRNLPGQQICITVPPAMSVRDRATLNAYLEDSPYAHLVDADVTGDFVLIDTVQGYTAVRQGSEEPRFFTTPDLSKLAFGLQVVAAWEVKRRLENPRPRLSERVIDLQLSRLTETGNFDTGRMEAIADWRGIHDFPYTASETNGRTEWISPAFGLRLQNRSPKPLWIAALYFTRDHAVSAGLLAPIEVQPERWVDLHYYSTQAEKDRKIIPLNIGKQLREAGINEVVEQVKVIVSTRSFSVTALEQAGLPMVDSTKRSSPPKRRVEQDEWRTYDLYFRIRRGEP